MAKKEIYDKLVECWNQRDFKGYEKLLHADYRYTGPDSKTIEGGPKVGVDVAKKYAAAFPDGVLTITNAMISGNTAVCEFVCRGTHSGELMGIAPTNKPVEIHVCGIVELKDGKVFREREYMDMLSLMQQIGVAPKLKTEEPHREEARPTQH